MLKSGHSTKGSIFLGKKKLSALFNNDSLDTEIWVKYNPEIHGSGKNEWQLTLDFKAGKTVPIVLLRELYTARKSSSGEMNQS